MSETDARTIHRLEAFSDIVMGFVLAEAGLGLAIPKDTAGLATMWPALSAFAFSFLLIATLWWNHHKLFVKYVYLNSATVVMNFALLAALALGSYFEQVAVHFAGGDIAGFKEPLRLWLACMALVFLFLAGMYAIGIWKRRHELDPPALRWGVNRTARALFGTVALSWLAVILPVLGKASAVTVATLAALAIGAVIRRLAVPRITAYLLAERASASRASGS